MNSLFSIWAILFICGFAIGFFIVFLFLINRARFPSQAFNVVGILLVLDLMLVGEILEELSVAEEFPMIVALGLPLDLLIWPFVIRYIDYLAGAPAKKLWIRMLPYIPFAIVLIGQFYFYVNGDEIKAFFESKSYGLLFMVGFKLIACAIFIIYIFRQISAGDLRQNDLAKRKHLQNVRKVFVAISTMIITIYLFFFNTYFGWFDLADSDRIGSLLITLCLYAFGYLVFTNPLALYTIATESSDQDTLTITSQGTHIILKPESIVWIESAGNYVWIHVEVESYKIRSTLSEFTARLDSRFLRIHRSYVVNLDFVSSFKHWRRGEYLVTLSNGKNVSPSRTYRNSMEVLLSRQAAPD